MSLIDRFKKYLEEAFRSIKPSREAMDYREEVLSTLLDRANEYKNNGETSEDTIFDKCIDSLGDFKSTLRIFEKERLNLKKTALKASQILLIALGAFFVVTIAYLAISLVLKNAWAKTWVIEVDGVLAVTIAILCSALPVLVKRKKIYLLRLDVAAIQTIFYVMVYLALLVLLPAYVSRTWLIFFLMIITILLGDTVLAYMFGQTKSGFIVLLLLIMAITVFLYVSLGLLGLVSWGIFWILPVAGAVLDFLLIVIKYVIWYKKKKEEINEEYYTKWTK